MGLPRSASTPLRVGSLSHTGKPKGRGGHGWFRLPPRTPTSINDGADSWRGPVVSSGVGLRETGSESTGERRPFGSLVGVGDVGGGRVGCQQ